MDETTNSSNCGPSRMRADNGYVYHKRARKVQWEVRRCGALQVSNDTVFVLEGRRKEKQGRLYSTVTLGHWQAMSLLPRDVTAEQAGLDPVDGDQNTVASY